jgi:hypothetical protein
MIQPNPSDCAYLSGLFDGEGSISYYQRLQKRKYKKRAYSFWLIRCEISMTDKPTIEWIYSTLKFGSYRVRLPTKSWKGKKTQWRWRVTHRDAFRFAKMIYPYSKTKAQLLLKVIHHYRHRGHV